MLMSNVHFCDFSKHHEDFVQKHGDFVSIPLFIKLFVFFYQLFEVNQDFFSFNTYLYIVFIPNSLQIFYF